jgi:NADH dehydrogenase
VDFHLFVRGASSAVTSPKQRGPVSLVLYRVFAYTGGFFLVSGCLVLAFFVYDATTYREDLTYADIPVSERALQPRRGGPKNLPIAEVLVDDDDCEERSKQRNKPKLVILGSGWGSVALLKMLHSDDYHVTVVSPVNYFLFTPMLPSATVGTLELRSLVEPIRRIVQRVQGHFLRAEAVDVELSERLLEVSQTEANGEKRHFYLPYDKLVIGVGTWAGKSRHKLLYLRICRFGHQSSWC